MAETDDTVTGSTGTDGTGTAASEPAAEPNVDQDPIAPQVPPAAPIPERRAETPKRSGPLLLLVGGVLAALAGFGVAQLVPNGWPIGNTSALQTELTAQVSQIEALKTQVLELSQRLDSSKLADRIAALEAAPAPTIPEPAASVDTSALEARIAALEARPAGASADPAAMAQLKAEIEAVKANGAAIVSPQVQASLDAKVKETEARLATIEATAKASAAAAISRAAVRQIAAALDSGTPYGAALADLAGTDLPAVLTDHAGTGLPTLPSLQAEFPDAARAALDAALRADMGATWTERVTNFLRTQTGARTLSPREGTDPDAILSRAEDATAKGDIATALTEIATLPPEGLAPLVAWQARARLRLEAEVALQALMAKAG